MPLQGMVLQGNAYAEMKKCGKPGCRCGTGRPHGPYFYRRYRENGRQRKVYVKASELASVSEACSARLSSLRNLRSQQAKALAQQEQGWREFRRMIAEIRRLEEETHAQR